MEALVINIARLNTLDRNHFILLFIILSSSYGRVLKFVKHTTLLLYYGHEQSPLTQVSPPFFNHIQIKLDHPIYVERCHTKIGYNVL